MIIKKPINIEKRNKVVIIFRLLNPTFFNNVNSFLTNISLKNICVDRRKINGNSSNKIIGVFKKVKKYGVKIVVLIFLKKEISSNIFNIKIRLKNIKLIVINLLKNFTNIYLI
jgi:hypothetical protein